MTPLSCCFSPRSSATMHPSHSRGPAGHRPQSIDNMIYLTFRPGRVARPLSVRDRPTPGARLRAHPRADLRHPRLSDPGATVHAMTRSGPTPPPGVQAAFDDLEPLLSEITFVVVDLETTGTRPGTDEITEIGAVRVRGGAVLAELSTFVSIEGPLPGHKI